MDDLALVRSALRDGFGVHATPTFVSREPLGAGVVSCYSFEADGAERFAFVDTSRLPVAAETGLLDPEDGARVWLHPADPHLPALAPVAFADALATVLARAGITTSGAPEIVGYRPGRRAVLRVQTSDGADAWAKVLRPSRAQRVAELHRALAGAVPLPEMIVWSPEGLLVLGSAVGQPAPEAHWSAAGLLTEVQALRARLSAADVTTSARTSVASRLPWYRERLLEDVEQSGDEAWALRESIQRAADAAASLLARARDDRGEVVIHGDLHFGQLFLTDGAITGVIDVDTAGIGHPADDEAAFAAHAIASLALSQTNAQRERLGELATQAWNLWGDSELTRGLVAVHLLGHAIAASGAADWRRVRVLLEAATDAAAESKNALTPLLDALHTESKELSQRHLAAST